VLNFSVETGPLSIAIVSMQIVIMINEGAIPWVEIEIGSI
jgi:hypothetical protein